MESFARISLRARKASFRLIAISEANAVCMADLRFNFGLGHHQILPLVLSLLSAPHLIHTTQWTPSFTESKHPTLDHTSSPRNRDANNSHIDDALWTQQG